MYQQNIQVWEFFPRPLIALLSGGDAIADEQYLFSVSYCCYYRFSRIGFIFDFSYFVAIELLKNPFFSPI